VVGSSLSHSDLYVDERGKSRSSRLNGREPMILGTEKCKGACYEESSGTRTNETQGGEGKIMECKELPLRKGVGGGCRDGLRVERLDVAK